jgi:hypothetical protein
METVDYYDKTTFDDTWVVIEKSLHLASSSLNSSAPQVNNIVPLRFNAKVLSNSSVLLSWEALTGASYRITQANANYSDTPHTPIASELVETHYRVNNLVPGRAYAFKLFAEVPAGTVIAVPVASGESEDEGGGDAIESQPLMETQSTPSSPIVYDSDPSTARSELSELLLQNKALDSEQSSLEPNFQIQLTETALATLQTVGPQARMTQQTAETSTTLHPVHLTSTATSSQQQRQAKVAVIASTTVDELLSTVIAEFKKSTQLQNALPTIALLSDQELSTRKAKVAVFASLIVDELLDSIAAQVRNGQSNVQLSLTSSAAASQQARRRTSSSSTHNGISNSEYSIATAVVVSTTSSTSTISSFALPGKAKPKPITIITLAASDRRSRREWTDDQRARILRFADEVLEHLWRDVMNAREISWTVETRTGSYVFVIEKVGPTHLYSRMHMLRPNNTNQKIK